MESYREELYGGMAYQFRNDEFPALVEEWLAELSRVGFRGMVPFRFHNPDISWPVPTKEQPDWFLTAVSVNLEACGDAYVVVP